MIFHSRGFTILELAVVLLIIALVVGGVMVGSDMIRNAERQAIGGEYERYVQAIKNFQDKYQALPGDFTAATSYWTASGSCPTASLTGTCNGDGNGRIINQGSDATATDTHYEQFIAWQHLALAGFIDGKFTGVDGGNGSQDRYPGVNVPEAKVSGAGWGLVSITAADIAGTVDCYNNITYIAGDTPPGHLLWFGGRSITPYYCNLQAPLFTAAEAHIIDTKLDDGIAITGKILGQNSSGCINAGNYDRSNTNVKCALVFKTGF